MAGFKMPFSLATLVRAIWDNNYIALASRTVTVSGSISVTISMQYVQGLVTFDASSPGQADIAISSVDWTRSALIPLGFGQGLSDSAASDTFGYFKNDATHVRLYGRSGGVGIPFAFLIISW